MANTATLIIQAVIRSTLCDTTEGINMELYKSGFDKQKNTGGLVG